MLMRWLPEVIRRTPGRFLLQQPQRRQCPLCRCLALASSSVSWESLGYASYGTDTLRQPRKPSHVLGFLVLGLAGLIE